MITIRYVDENDDRYEISNIYEQSWKSAYKGILSKKYLDSIPKGRWAENIDNPGWFTLVCLEDDKIIGTCSFCESRFPEYYPRYGEIISMYFLPGYTRKGYGSLLMKRVLDEMREFGFKQVFLWVLEENKPAIAFYEKMDFLRAPKRRTDNIGGRTVHEISYWYNLVEDEKKKQEMIQKRRAIVEKSEKEVVARFNELERSISFGAYLAPENYFVSYVFKTEAILKRAKNTGLTEKINEYHRKILRDNGYPSEGIKNCRFASQEACDREWNGNWFYYYK